MSRKLFDDINRKYMREHRILELKKERKQITFEEFTVMHKLLWLLHEKELVENSFIEPYTHNLEESIEQVLAEKKKICPNQKFSFEET